MPHKDKHEHAAYERERRKTHPQLYKKMHRRKILRQYGLTEQAFENMLAAQEGRCLICRKRSKRQFHVDHDHASGKVRGLLCGNCNMALGLLHEDTDTIQRMYEYVLAHREK